MIHLTPHAPGRQQSPPAKHKMRTGAAAAAAVILAAAIAASSAALAAASEISFSQAKFSLTTLDGSSRLTDTFTPSSSISSLSPEDLVSLQADEIIRLSFVVSKLGASPSPDTPQEGEEEVDAADGQTSARVPEQIVVQLINVAQPSKVAGFRTSVNRQSGKVIWSQRVDRLPTSSLGSESPTYQLRLIIGSSRADKPLSLSLGQVEIPHLSKFGSSKPSPREVAARELGFYPWEEKRHTFRKEVTEDMPGKTRSLAVAAIVVIVPWLVLSGLLSTLLPSITFSGTPKVSTSLLFLALFFLETLGYRYYRGDFVLFVMLPYFLLGSFVAAAAILAGAVKGVGLKGGA